MTKEDDYDRLNYINTFYYKNKLMIFYLLSSLGVSIRVACRVCTVSVFFFFFHATRTRPVTLKELRTATRTRHG